MCLYVYAIRYASAELAHGVYNFKDVWGFFKKLGWTTRAGGELGYDHYYIKPGKSVRTDEEGKDFFYGEAALVAYGMKKKIFGEVPAAPPPRLRSVPPTASQQRSSAARSSVSESMYSSVSTSEYEESMSSDAKQKPWTPASNRKRLRKQEAKALTRQSQKRKRTRDQSASSGKSVNDPISILSSGSEASTMSLHSSSEDSDDASAEQEEEESDDSSSSVGLDMDSEEDPNDDDIVVVTAGVLASKLKGNFQAKKRAPRPLLRTQEDSDASIKRESKKRVRLARVKSEPKHSTRHSAVASKSSAPSSSASPSSSSSAKYKQKYKQKRKKAVPRRLSVETDSHEIKAKHAHSSSTTAPLEPAPRVTSQAHRAPASPQHSFLSPTPRLSTTEKAKTQREVTPSTQGSQVFVQSSGERDMVEDDGTDDAAYEPEPPPEVESKVEEPAQRSSSSSSTHQPPATTAATTDTTSTTAQAPEPGITPAEAASTPDERANTASPLPLSPPSAPSVATAQAPADSPVTIHLELDEVLFPSQKDHTYRVWISSTETPKRTTIAIEHIQSRERRCALVSMRASSCTAFSTWSVVFYAQGVHVREPPAGERGESGAEHPRERRVRSARALPAIAEKRVHELRGRGPTQECLAGDAGQGGPAAARRRLGLPRARLSVLRVLAADAQVRDEVAAGAGALESARSRARRIQERAHKLALQAQSLAA